MRVFHSRELQAKICLSYEMSRGPRQIFKISLLMLINAPVSACVEFFRTEDKIYTLRKQNFHQFDTF